MLQIQRGTLAELCFAMLLLGVLTSCASPATLEGMTVQSMPTAPIPRQLNQSVEVGSVLGGETTNPMWTSEVGNEEFREALEASLRNAGILTPDGGKPQYVVDAKLVDVNQPMIGFSFTVTSTVEYTVRSAGSGDVAWKDTVMSPYTASATSSFLGTTRLRLANEGSIRTNIQTFIEHLVTHFRESNVSLAAVRSRVYAIFTPGYGML